MESHKIIIRVRYQETDAQGIVHHGNYLTYFEKRNYPIDIEADAC